ncbi:MAG: hypothetical protein CL484_12705 [Acidobacteria bacterium]|nr:hypothetical protein [Acidobacteriota bacterium]
MTVLIFSCFTRRLVRGVFLVFAMFWVQGCGLTEAEPPVATVSVGLNRQDVPLGGPLEMNYRFSTATEGLVGGDEHRIFVHFLDEDGQLMFTDDHEPPDPTSGWRSGQSVTYDRRMTVPVYPYIGTVTVAVGLYSPRTGERLPMVGDDLGQRAYQVASFNMAPQSESGFLMFDQGWHPVESSPDDPMVEWQWTTGESIITFRNPKVDSTFYLEVQGRPELFENPQVLSLRIGEVILQSIELSGEQSSYHVIQIPSSAFGSNEMVELTLGVDQTFVPAVVTEGENLDDRELGIQLFYAFLEID